MTGQDKKKGVQGHMRTFGVVTASGGGLKGSIRSPKMDKMVENAKNDPNLQNRSDFWLVGEARHEIRDERPYGKL